MGAAGALGEAKKLQVLAPPVLSPATLGLSTARTGALELRATGAIALPAPTQGWAGSTDKQNACANMGDIMIVPYADVWRAVCTNICSDFTLHTVTSTFPEQGHSSLQLCVSIRLARRANHNVTPPAICGPSGSASRNTTHANSRCAARNIQGSENTR